jgi:hypothetical protein
MHLLPGETPLMVCPDFGIMLRLGLRLFGLSGDSHGMGLNVSYRLLVVCKMPVKATDACGH